MEFVNIIKKFNMDRLTYPIPDSRCIIYSHYIKYFDRDIGLIDISPEDTELYFSNTGVGDPELADISYDSDGYKFEYRYIWTHSRGELNPIIAKYESKPTVLVKMVLKKVWPYNNIATKYGLK